MSTASSTTTPSAEGTPDALLLLPLRQRLLEQSLGVRSVRVRRPGRPEVRHLYRTDTAENIYSVSKTVTTLAVGMARAEGLLDVEDRVVDLIAPPSEGFGRGVDRILVRHLLTMTSGSPITAFADEERDHPEPSALLLATDLADEPGTRFEYSNGGMLLLSRLIAERSGQSLRDYLMPRLFEPLGIVNPQWHTTRDGTTWGATGLHLRSDELARIGDVLLGRGTVAGRELVPATWIDTMHAEQTWVETGEEDAESTHYGYGVWRSTPAGAWRADGAFGQLLLVLPEQQAVVTITAHLEGRPVSDIQRAVWEELLPLL